MEVFGQFGFKKASIEEIAQRAKVGKGSVYLHFESKEALFEAVVRQNINSGFAVLEGLLASESAPEGKLRVYLCHVLDQRLQVANKMGRAPRGLEFAERMIELVGAGMNVIEEYRARALKSLQGILCEGRDAGVFHMENLQITSEAILGAVVTTSTAFFNDKEHCQQIVHTLSELIVRGLMSAPTPAS